MDKINSPSTGQMLRLYLPVVIYIAAMVTIITVLSILEAVRGW